MSEYLTDKQVEECKYMLSKNQYYHTDKSGSKNAGDDMVLLKYLQELGYSKDGALKMWAPIYESAYGHFSDDGTHGNTLFEAMWKKAETMKKRPIKTINVYQNEIDAINNMDGPRWVKELLFLVLVKVKSKNKYVYHEPLINKMIKYTSITKRTVSNYRDALKMFEDAGFLMYELEDWYDNTDGQTYQIDRYTYKFPAPEGMPVVVLCNEKEALNHLSLVEMYKVCPVCGEKFAYNTKTKREVCLNCWKKEQVAKATERRHRHADGVGKAGNEQK